MSKLHLVNKAQHSHTALKDCLSVCTAGDAIVLIEDGVYNACNKHEVDGVEIFAMQSDIDARGLSQILQTEGITLIGYPELVELSVQHHSSINWS